MQRVISELRGELSEKDRHAEYERRALANQYKSEIASSIQRIVVALGINS
jgi:hypothetical protein